MNYKRLIIKILLLTILLILSYWFVKSVFAAKQYYSMRWRSFAFNDLPQRKLDVYKRNNIPFYTFVKLASVNAIECWRDDGFCYSSSDVWPFQINQIHKVAYAHSVYLIREKDDYEELFDYQMLRTYKRMLSQVDRFDLWDLKDKTRAYRLFIFHNGNNKLTCNGRERKYYYADKWIKVRKMLIDLYINKY